MGHYDKKQLTIMTTSRCNMRCKYCITESRAGETLTEYSAIIIDETFAKLAIKDYLEGNEEPWIRFYGSGEATLEIDLMKKLIAYADSIALKPIYYELQSNTYYSEEIAHFIADKFDIIYVSYDAMPDINDSLRPGEAGENTSPVVERNIKILTQKAEVAIRSTISPLNLHKQKEMIDYFLSLGVKSVFSKPVLSSVDSKENTEYSVDLMEYAREYLDAYHYAKEKGVFYGNIYVSNFDRPTSIFCRACVPYPHATPDGFITCCDRAFCGNSSLEDLIYAHYDVDKQEIIYDQEKIKRIQSRTIENMPTCMACRARYYCGGACLGTAYQRTGTMFEPYARECEAICFLYDNLVGKIDLKVAHP